MRSGIFIIARRNVFDCLRISRTSFTPVAAQPFCSPYTRLRLDWQDPTSNVPVDSCAKVLVRSSGTKLWWYPVSIVIQRGGQVIKNPFLRTCYCPQKIKTITFPHSKISLAATPDGSDLGFRAAQASLAADILQSIPNRALNMIRAGTHGGTLVRLECEVSRPSFRDTGACFFELSIRLHS